MKFTPCFVLGLLLMVASGAAAAEGPNLVVVLADDLGVECVGAYGGLSYQTPNLDRLAASGLRFTHCFSNPYCSPSRAQLMTGRYPLHNGIRRVIYDPQRHREFLDPQQQVCFARLLKQAGYATAIAGKWQVSFLHERDTVRAHGFDEYQLWQIFHEGKKTSRYANPTLRENGRLRREEFRGSYGPDENVKFLIDFMRRHRKQPFCVYYTCLLPHYPWEPTPDSKEPLQAATGKGNWKKYMPDMVAYLDKQVGQLVSAVDDLGLRENTLVLFVADNGTDRNVTSQWHRGAIKRQVPGGKGTLTDAGTRVPLIANWSGKIQAGVCDDLVDLSDILPTLVELAGADLPKRAINGRSFAPQLRGEAGTPRGWIHVQDHDNRYVRDREFILTNQGKFRPVVDIGQRPAKPLTGNLNAEQQAARKRLQRGLEKAAELSGASSR